MTRFYQLPRLLAAAFIALFAIAQFTNAESLVNADNNKVAVKGYDVVSYFTEGKPTRGSKEHEHMWRDARWLFSSEENRSKFASDPTKFAPRYGGFCAGGMALGRRAPIDPEAFIIVDGKLFLNFDKPTAEEFQATSDESIAKADANWRKMNKN